MGFGIRRVGVLVIAALGAIAIGCGSEVDDEKEGVGTTEDKYIEAFAESSSGGPQGGCSNEQIQHCYRNVCKGSVSACWNNNPSPSYFTCDCVKGDDYWIPKIGPNPR